MKLKEKIEDYKSGIFGMLNEFNTQPLDDLANELNRCWRDKKQIFVCGNGGSAANADHAANDLVYGLNPNGEGINAHSLCANFSVNSCAANDTGYENIFAHQIRVMTKPEDLLIVFSGSGNSENIIRAIELAKELEVRTAGVLGFDGGRAKDLLDIPIHFPINDMQISEDLQMIVIHVLMQYLRGSTI